MRIPLIVTARPSEDVKYPRVTLRSGRWKFSSNHADSCLRVNTLDLSVGLHEDLDLPSATQVYISCDKAGTETSITVYACLSH